MSKTPKRRRSDFGDCIICRGQRPLANKKYCSIKCRGVGWAELNKEAKRQTAWMGLVEPPEEAHSVVHALYRAMVAHRIGITELAELAGYSHNTVRGWLEGRTDPHIGKIAKVADILEIAVVMVAKDHIEEMGAVLGDMDEEDVASDETEEEYMEEEFMGEVLDHFNELIEEHGE